MTPESAAHLIVLDLSLKDSKVGCQVDLYEREGFGAGEVPPLMVSWNTVERPAGFDPVGGGVVFVRRPPGYEHRTYTAEPSPRESRLAWRYPVPPKGLMMVVVLPAGYVVPNVDDADPVLVESKDFNGRMVIFWLVPWNPTGQADVSWRMEKAQDVGIRDLRPHCASLNTEAAARRSGRPLPTPVDLDAGSRDAGPRIEGQPGPSRSSSKKEPSGGSFWTTGPGILTGIAAIITAIGGLIAVLHTAGLLGGSPGAPPDRVTGTPAVVATASSRNPQSPSAAQPAPPAGAAGSDGCFATYFQQLPKSRVLALEAGTRDFQLIGPDQPKDAPIGVRFTDGNQPIGAMRFTVVPSSSIFKVETVVDAECRSLEDYSNASRGGDKHTLQNWDSLKMHLGNRSYELRLGYDAGTVSASYFIRVSQ